MAREKYKTWRKDRKPFNDVDSCGHPLEFRFALTFLPFQTLTVCASCHALIHYPQVTTIHEKNSIEKCLESIPLDERISTMEMKVK